jgi:hypothetical protein
MVLLRLLIEAVISKLAMWTVPQLPAQQVPHKQPPETASLSFSAAGLQARPQQPHQVQHVLLLRLLLFV